MRTIDTAAYWFRQTGDHPVLDELAEDATELGFPDWSPFAFIDRVERVIGSGSEEEVLCQQIQLREWDLLFDYSLCKALGK